MTKTKNYTTPQSVLDAMSSLKNEEDAWKLAEALQDAAPAFGGNQWFKQVRDDATDAGIPSLSVTTLRLYRDTAARWPKNLRIPNVSFSAHREAMAIGVSDGAEILRTMVDTQGAHKVTVSAVRKAIAAHNGTPSAKAGGPITVSVADLQKGAPKFIAAIRAAGFDLSTLDKIRDGLNLTLTEVDSLRSKAARKKGKGKAPAAAKVVPIVAPPTIEASDSTESPEGVVVGDLRGM